MSHYQKPPELYEGLRLHQNENTGGCSPRVIEALARLRPDQIGFYPPYAAATEAVARYLDVPTERITLVNGLDEGIMAVAVAYLRAAIGGPQLEAIVPEPAFEIFRFDTAVAGGRLVQVMPHADFSFPLDEVLAAAVDARNYARARFSGFKVGAALETSAGDVVSGCNVENATYGLTMCAERVALYKALSEGRDAFTRIAVVADTEDPTPPCGSCRQLLWEYCGDIEVVLANLSEVKRRLPLSQLLPMPFDGRLLK